MSEFDRTENFRRSIRRRKPLAPSPPQIESKKIDEKKIEEKKRDFSALPAKSIKETKNSFIADEDNSLMAIQRQINMIEFNLANQKENSTVDPLLDFVEPTVVNKSHGIGSLTNKPNRTSESMRVKSTTAQGDQNDAAPKMVKRPIFLGRTASDSSEPKFEILRKHIRHKELLPNKKVEGEVKE